MRIGSSLVSSALLLVTACHGGPAGHGTDTRGLAAIDARLDETWRSDEPAMAMRAEDGAFLARSATQGFDARIGTDGVEVRLHDGSPSIRLRTRAIERGPARALVAEGRARADGSRVHIARRGVDELFAHGAAGIEHAIAITERPAGEGPLEVVLSIEGASALRVADDVITMLDASGAAYLEYAGLRAWDGAGRPLPVRFAQVTGGARIVVDDRGASSPIVIDPLIAAPRGVIVASDAAENGGFGSAIAVDGDWAVIGARDHADTGVAYVLERTGTSWSERAVIVPPDARSGDDVGRAVAISGDTLAIASPHDDAPTFSSAGSVHVYRRGAAGWTLEQRIENPDPTTSNERFGDSIALAGNVLVVGAPGDRAYFSGGGGAYVYARTGTTWALEQALVPSTISSNDNFGSAVATDGTRIAASSIYDAGIVPVGGFVPRDVGAVFVFARGVVEPWEQEARLSSSSPERSYELCGSSLALRGDRLIAGAPRGDDDEEFLIDRGVAYVWSRGAGGWALEARLYPAPMSDWTNYARFGSAVGIDGDVAVVGATGVYRASLGRAPGFAYVYRRDVAGSWAGELDITGRVLTSDYGHAIGLDGSTLLVGAPNEQASAGDDQGAVYAYELVEPRADGDPCTAATECVSGFCADGVCCESACGGGAADCRACSVAAGAATDGVCGTAAAATVCRAAATACDAEETCDGIATTCPADVRAPAGTECRPATGECDVAETCDGTGVTCPADAFATDGSPCDDGMLCDGADVCSLGTCVGGGTPLDCDDDDACTADACAEPDGCAHTPIAGCCAIDADCDDDDACTADRCDGAACVHEATGACDDAGAGAPDAGMGDAGTTTPASGGCGCAVPGRSAPARERGALFVLALAASVLARRRRTCRS